MNGRTIYYFSPAGGTRHIANLIAGSVEGTGMDMTVQCKDREHDGTDLVFFCVPSYGGRVPTPVAERMNHLRGNGTPAVLVAVYGNRAADDTLPELRDLAEERGFVPVAACEMIAPHSVDTRFGSGRPDADDLRKLKAFLRDAVNKDASSPVKIPGHAPYRQYDGIPIKPMVLGRCIRCGNCVRNCPVGAISLASPNKTDRARCISCMRCIQVCTTGARRIPAPLQLVAAVTLKKYCGDRKEPVFLL